jgi:hypothetical protein
MIYLMSETDEKPILSHFGKNVIIGILAFKLITTISDKLVFPLIDAYILDSRTFNEYNVYVDKDTKDVICIPKKKVESKLTEIGTGDFMKEIIIFAVLVSIIYYFF